MLGLYRLLLALLPREFRREYGDEVCRVVAEQWADARPALGSWGRVRFWCRQLWSLVRSAVTVRKSARKHSRDASGTRLLALTDDVRSAVRSLSRRPAFTTLCVVILALGIGAATSIFSVISAVLLRSLPFEGGEKMVEIREVPADVGEGAAAFGGAQGEIHASAVTVSAWQREQSAVQIASYTLDESRFVGEDPAVVPAARVNGNFFSLLGVPLWIGRSPTIDELGPDTPATVIIGHLIWQELFGGDPAILGRTLSLAGRLADQQEDFTIIGVAPPGFDFPEGARLWKTRRLPQRPPEQVRVKTERVIGRLQSGTTLERAQAELTQIAASVPFNEGWEAQLRPLHEVVAARFRPALLLLSGAVTLLLLIACANVGCLMLVRAVARRAELSVRTSLGGVRGRIVRTLIIEGLVVGLAAGALGTVFATGVVRLLPLPGFLEVGVDRSALVFAAAVALLTGLVAAAAPALHAASNVTPALREGARQIVGVGSGLWSVLVVSEIALSAVLLTGAGVLLRSLLTVLAVDPGFQAEQVTAFEIRMSGALAADNVRRWSFPEELADRVQALPGVLSAATTRHLPMTASGEPNPIRVEGRDVDATLPPAHTTSVSPGYFRTMGIDVLSGREFGPGAATRFVAVVNQSFERTFFPGEDALGRRVARAFGGMNDFEIIGVVRDTRQTGLAEAPEPVLYMQSAVDGSPTFHLVVRSVESLAALVPAVRAAAGGLDPTVLVPLVTPLTEVVERSAARPRFYAVAVTTSAAVALGLSLFGLYTVLSHAVAQRRPEIAIRVTLGALPSEILSLFLRHGLRLAALGVGIGLVAAVAATRLLARFLFGVRPLDPASFAAAALVLLAAAVAATLLPAYRATRVDPAQSLQS